MSVNDRWLVLVRAADDTWNVYGVYGSEQAAQRKANIVNRLLPQDVESNAWAYAMPLLHATTAKKMVDEASPLHDSGEAA